MIVTKSIDVSGFVQGGFYVDSGTEYDTGYEIRSDWIDSEVAISSVSVNCDGLQWSFICKNAEDEFISINESYGYKNSGTEIDLSAYPWVRKIRVELHSDSGLKPPVSCTLVLKLAYYWTVKNGVPVPIDAPDAPEKAVEPPLPLPLWRVEPAKNNGYPFTGLMPIAEARGAFRNAEKLERVYIPETVRKIGAEAFRYTALKRVRISADCQYFPTSFPEGCEVEFYGGGGDFGQLYDCDGYAILDCEAARIYVRRDTMADTDEKIRLEVSAKEVSEVVLKMEQILVKISELEERISALESKQEVSQ